MNSTENQCVKAIASFNMFDGFYIITYVDGSQKKEKVNYRSIRVNHHKKQAEKRKEFSQTYPDFRVNAEKLRLFDLIAFEGYHTKPQHIEKLKEDKDSWKKLCSAMAKGQSLYRALRIRNWKYMDAIDRLCKRMFPIYGHDIGKHPRDWRFPNDFSFSAPVSNKDLADSFIDNHLLPKNFYNED